jgi:hypothetical protein
MFDGQHFWGLVILHLKVRRWCHAASVVGRSMFVPSEYAVKVIAVLEDRSKYKQHELVAFGMWRIEEGRDPSTVVCQEWTEVFAAIKWLEGEKMFKSKWTSDDDLMMQTGDKQKQCSMLKLWFLETLE